jgi:hypothetical protein
MNVDHPRPHPHDPHGRRLGNRSSILCSRSTQAYWVPGTVQDTTAGYRVKQDEQDTGYKGYTAVPRYSRYRTRTRLDGINII